MCNGQIIAIQLEYLRDKLPLLFERDDLFFSLINKPRLTPAQRKAVMPENQLPYHYRK